eukprot:TRINITY_DN2897_c0_g1_i1.p1 TRINITY_DN2897_c0_g1~~TRINITY_DN2897_c0_g1_i1.p1  ORF type:complete len:616 (-),score=98.82 TRINITY_DN2897_c0_g1_i1:101-1948(-)
MVRWREGGSWLARQYRGIVVVLTVIGCLPLFIWENQLARMGGVLLMMAIFWVCSVVNLGVTALLPVVLFPFLGIASADEVAAAYFNDSIFLFLGGFLIAIAMEKWNLHKRISMSFLITIGNKPRLLLLGFMVISFVISMWMNTSAAVLIMVPLVLSILNQAETDEKVVDDTEVAPVLTQSQTDYGTGSAGSEDTELTLNQLYDMRDLHKQFKVCMLLGVTFSTTLGGVSTIIGSPANLAFFSIFKIMYPDGPAVSFSNWTVYAFPICSVFLVIMWAFFSFIWCRRMGNLVFETHGLRKYYRDLGPLRFEEAMILFDMVLMIILWFTRSFGVTGTGWKEWFKLEVGDGTVAILVTLSLFFVPSASWLVPASIDPYDTDDEDELERLEEADRERRRSIRGKRRRREAEEHRQEQLRLLKQEIEIERRKQSDEIDGGHRRSRLLEWRDTDKLPWDILLLLGGGYALALGFSRTGLAEWAGEQLEDLSVLPTPLIVVAICVIISFATEIMSTVAVANVSLPVLGSIAAQLGENPLLFMLPATISASFAFMLPIATASNAIVFASGHVRMRDMIAPGFVFTVIGIGLVSSGTYLLVPDVWGVEYGVRPDWAMRNATTTPS